MQDTRSLHFDGWLSPRSAALSGLVDQLFAALPQPEITAGRRHRSDAVERRKRCLEALVANLALMALSPAKYDGLAVSLKNRRATRYEAKAFNTLILRSVVSGMEALSLLEHDDAVFRQKRTVLRETEKLRALLVGCDITLRDVGRTAGRETIELWMNRHGPQGKEAIDYSDTERTTKLRQEMAEINEMLAKTNIAFDKKPLPASYLVRKFHRDSAALRPGFDRHGRLYGGVWQDLPKSQRYLLSINEEPLADLDFSSMFIQLAYSSVGHQPPLGDLYAIPGLENYRKVVKSLIVSLFFRTKAAARLPAGSKELLPEGWDMAKFKAAAAAHHPAIAHLFDTNIGFRLMAMESDILVEVLLRLAKLGVPALPMHDGIMVPVSQKLNARRTMEEVSAKHVGWPLAVAEKPIEDPRINNFPLWSTMFSP